MALAPPSQGRAAASGPMVEDFDIFWQTLGDNYCYFDEKATDWDCAGRHFRRLAVSAGSANQLAGIVSEALHTLYDPHSHVIDPPDGTPRYPPFDLVVTPAGLSASVLSVRPGSAAAAATIAVGDRITHVGGRSIAQMAHALAPRCLHRPDDAATLHAWNRAVAGHRGEGRLLTVAGRGDIMLPLAAAAPEPPLSWRPLGDDLGLIRIASFSDSGIVDMFDAALGRLRHARGLLLDVRNNGGGDTAIARPIMGRFTRQTRPYALMRRRRGAGLGPFWTETVDPRGPFTFERPVSVLCDRWSASMAEGFPMGMRAISSARIVGQPMMGLGAAVFRVRLPHTGIMVQYSAEPVYDVDGRSRSTLQPDILVADGADVLAAGLLDIQRRAATA